LQIEQAKFNDLIISEKRAFHIPII
jgi:hypothetical protein